MKKYLAFLLAVFMLLGMMSVASAADGTYSATVSGMHGPLTVEVTLAGDRIEKVELVDNVETPGLIDWPASIVTADIVENQSLVRRDHFQPCDYSRYRRSAEDRRCRCGTAQGKARACTEPGC